jgi:hypothetical protein
MGEATELPWSEFNRQVKRFTRHTLQLFVGELSSELKIMDRNRVTWRLPAPGRMVARPVRQQVRGPFVYFVLFPKILAEL